MTELQRALEEDDTPLFARRTLTSEVSVRPSRPTKVRTSVSKSNSNKPTFPRRSYGMSETETTIFTEEMIDEYLLDGHMEEVSAKIEEDRNRSKRRKH